MAILLELRLTRDQFRALSWVDQRMYMEQLIILDYERKKNYYDNLPEDQKWEAEEPQIPEILLKEQELLEIEAPIAQDVMSGL